MAMDWVGTLIIPLVKSIVMLLMLLGGFAYMTYFERKVVSRFQVRIGPNRAGPFGILQPIADGIKAAFKEELIPDHVDKVVYLLAPALSLVPALTIFAVIPVGPPVVLLGREIPLQVADVNVGLLYILAIASLGTYGIVLAGWSSNNKYSLLGALRTSAQMISYELPMGVILVSLLILTGSLSTADIVVAQGGTWFGLIPRWYVFYLPVGLIGFLVYFVCGIAEANRSPFDLPETENELVAGYATEYGGIKFALFFGAEYINMINVSAIATTLFLGGWQGPFIDRIPLLGVIYFALKMTFLLFVFVWVRASLPRLRYDQLMAFCWKFLFPLALINVAMTAVMATYLGVG
jgi:NADH-quinone oxidoreductase subunit H